MAEVFRVWAPQASAVDLVWAGGSGTARTSMMSAGGGWWSAVPAEPVTDYGFVVDGDGPFPDPRSRWQPNGVHDLSRVFDADRHHWTDGRWRGRQLAGSVIYELHLGTFTPEGTLDAASGKLAHLVGLGVDFVELLPVNGFNGTHNWGYDGVAWYAVHDDYGGPAAYQRFVDACHGVGIGVIQDVVYNHLGPSGNYLPRFGPYLDEGQANTWGARVNLDGPGSDEVRRYIVDNALMWLRDYHVDGLRLDAVHAMIDHGAIHILEELAGEVDVLSASVGRPLSLIAESDQNDPRLITPREAGGFGITAQWSDDFHHALHVALTGESAGYYADFAPLSALGKVTTRGFFHDGSYSSFRGRHHGRPLDLDLTPAWRLVVSAQNHDQIGNRAVGDRLTATLDAGQLAIAAALTLLGPFTPMLFMGEEWGASTPWQFFTSHPEPEFGRATAEGRIAEFERMGWDPDAVPDPQDPLTFERSRLRWDEPGHGQHRQLLEFYRALIGVRRRHPQFTDPRLTQVRTIIDPTDRLVTMRRADATVVANLAAEPRTLQAPDGREVLSFAVDGTAVHRDEPNLRLAGHTVAVFVP